VHTEFSRAEPTLSICKARPQNRLVLAHAGAALSPQEVERVLEACPNVWMDLSARDPWRFVNFPISGDDGRLLPEQYTPDRIAAEDVQALLRGVQVREANDLSARFPAEMPVRLAIVLKDGRRLERAPARPAGARLRPHAVRGGAGHGAVAGGQFRPRLGGGDPEGAVQRDLDRHGHRLAVTVDDGGNLAGASQPTGCTGLQLGPRRCAQRLLLHC
jgi:hypothetical protein